MYLQRIDMAINPHKETLELNSNAGELCTVNSVESTFNAMQKIVSNSAQLQKLAAYRIIEEQLNAKVMSEKYQDYYCK